MNKMIPSVIQDNGEYYIHMEEYKKTKELGEHYKHLYSEIKKQKDEIEYLKRENERLKKLEDSYIYIQNQVENTANEIKANAKYEAELIIKEAKDNASSIVNDALLKAEKLNSEREQLSKSLKIYKRKVKSALMEQLEIIDDIEVL